jgi:hypothetical protein
MKIPRMIEIPSSIQHMVLAFYQKSRWKESDSARLGALMTLEFSKMKDEMREVIKMMSISIAKTENIKAIDTDFFHVILEDGTKIPFPEDAIAKASSILMEMDSIDNAVELSGAAIKGIAQDSKKKRDQMLSLIQDSIPQCREGDWRIDIEKMMVVEVHKIEEPQK